MAVIRGTEGDGLGNSITLTGINLASITVNDFVSTSLISGASAIELSNIEAGNSVSVARAALTLGDSSNGRLDQYVGPGHRQRDLLES